MTVGIQIVWWIGLVGALVITLVILREVELVLRQLYDINKLAKFTRTAAQGIGRNVAVIPSLTNVAGPAQEIRQSAERLAAATRLIEQKLAGLLPGRPQSGPQKGGTE